jgi:hypothetical protein
LPLPLVIFTIWIDGVILILLFIFLSFTELIVVLFILLILFFVVIFRDHFHGWGFA